jgi:hypothetical protein
MDAHLWRLTTALETLAVIGVQRQLSGLELLADETWSRGVRLGTEIGVADAYAVYHEQRAEIGRLANDTDVLAAEATLAEGYGVHHGSQSVVAEAAGLWLRAGDHDRAAQLALQVAGGGFDVVPDDVDWLLTVARVTEAAAGAGLTDITAEGVRLLAPFAGRSVVNAGAGAVVFVGVIEDYLWQGALATGDARADDWRAAAATAYRRLGAPWWLRRVSPPCDIDHSAAVPQQGSIRPRTVALRPVAGRAVWSVGPTAACGSSRT